MAATTFQQMYDADIASIAAATTYATDSNAIDVSDVEIVAVQGKATGGNASAVGVIDINLVGSVDGTNYDTVVFATVSFALSGAAEVRGSGLVNVRGLNKLKVTSIKNNDASYTADSVNVFIGKTIV